MRSMTPDIAYNELEDRGFSVRMIEKNGVVYAVMEGHDPEAPDKNPTCIQWAEDGKVFHANFRDMKDDDAALAFCNYVTIPVK